LFYLKNLAENITGTKILDTRYDNCADSNHNSVYSLTELQDMISLEDNELISPKYLYNLSSYDAETEGQKSAIQKPLPLNFKDSTPKIQKLRSTRKVELEQKFGETNQL
jgi:hypothetical protein